MGKVEPIKELEVSLMIDFETLGVSRDAVLLSCGMILFDDEVIIQEIYKEYNISTQIGDGSTVDPNTVAWWKRTDDQEFNRLLNISDGAYPPFHLNNVMKGLEETYKIRHVWSRGHMDFEILNYHLGDKIPYWKSKDCSTLDIFQKMGGTNTHNALGDCRNQVNHVHSVMGVFNAVQISEED